MNSWTQEPGLDTLGKRISACMKQSGISMRALSRKLSISQPSVCKWTHDEAVPKIEHIEAMAVIFHVTPEWLAFGRTDPYGKADDGKNEISGREECDFSFRISDVAAKARFGVESNELMLLPIHSDEMSPNLNVGDTVIVNKAATIEVTSGVYVFAVGSDYAVRRVQRLLSGSLRITCDNKNYPETETVNDSSELQVVGKVVSTIKLTELL